MIDFTKYPEVIGIDSKHTKLFNENIYYDGRVFNKTHRSEKEKQELLRQYREEYASVVFHIFCEIDPVLIEQRTGNLIKFSSVYGYNFAKLNEDMKIQLVNYANMGAHIYGLNEEVKSPEGKIIPAGVSPARLGNETQVWRNGEVMDRGFINGIPTGEIAKMTPEERLTHGRKWRTMTDEQKIEFMKQYKKNCWRRLLKNDKSGRL
jgi:hypothetical protein